MEGHTLVAIIRTTRSDLEYLARNRDEIIETLDSLFMNAGDFITISMEYVIDGEMIGLPEATHELITAEESGVKLALPEPL